MNESNATTRKNAVLVVVLTTAIHTLVSMALMALPTIAPIVAGALGVPSGLIGFQVSMMFGFSMVTSILGGGLALRLGSARLSQMALLLVGAGLLVCTLPSLSAIGMGSALIGIGYALPGPAASHLLMRYAPAHRRNVLFSIKQTGVPLGGVLAGIIAPPLAQVIDWRAPLFLTAFSAVVLAALLSFVRRTWDSDRDPARPIVNPPADIVRLVLGAASLRNLSVYAFVMAAIQVCITAFLVVLLVEDYGLSIIAAGGTAAAVQVAGMLGRVAWGILADTTRNGLRILVIISFMIAALAFALGLFAKSQLLATGILVALGATGIGWNGVFLAEAARLAPAGRVSEVTSGVLSVTFLGLFVGPALFAMAVPLVGGYRPAYLLLGGAALIVGLSVQLRSSGQANRA